MEPRIKSRAEQEVSARNGGRDVPDLIRELYLDQGLSQEDVADRLGVHRITVVNWMRDWRIPTRDRRAVPSEPTEATA